MSFKARNGILETVHTSCPRCKKTFEVPDSRHYQQVACPGCNHSFQALSDDTVRLSRDFLKAEFEKKRRGGDREDEG